MHTVPHRSQAFSKFTNTRIFFTLPLVSEVFPFTIPHFPWPMPHSSYTFITFLEVGFSAILLTFPRLAVLSNVNVLSAAKFVKKGRLNSFKGNTHYWGLKQ